MNGEEQERLLYRNDKLVGFIQQSFVLMEIRNNNRSETLLGWIKILRKMTIDRR